ncbi:DNA/RNA non-specific endonuclease [Sorangium sp. So ce513]|uniref:DNA/RNA non-specific endonuclease n=1 Tax=Sorangium sp. So ce513 TaxID=3133315 RepID=UPI003F602A23
MSIIRTIELLGLDRRTVFEAKVEHFGARCARTLQIAGEIQHFQWPYRPANGVRERTGFDHRGHLIARCFGGPNRRANLVAMHGLVNMSGGPWYKMEREIISMLGKEAGWMRIDVEYLGSDLRPDAFLVVAGRAKGPLRSWQIVNANPYLYPTRDWRAQRQAELDAQELAEGPAQEPTYDV